VVVAAAVVLAPTGIIMVETVRAHTETKTSSTEHLNILK
jgi:hypothetical protein